MWKCPKLTSRIKSFKKHTFTRDHKTLQEYLFSGTTVFHFRQSISNKSKLENFESLLSFSNTTMEALNKRLSVSRCFFFDCRHWTDCPFLTELQDELSRRKQYGVLVLVLNSVCFEGNLTTVVSLMRVALMQNEQSVIVGMVCVTYCCCVADGKHLFLDLRVLSGLRSSLAGSWKFVREGGPAVTPLNSSPASTSWRFVNDDSKFNSSLPNREVERTKSHRFWW